MYHYVPTLFLDGWLNKLTNHSMVCLSKISDGGHDQQLPSLQKTCLSSALGCGNLTWPRNLHFSLENSRKTFYEWRYSAPDYIKDATWSVGKLREKNEKQWLLDYLATLGVTLYAWQNHAIGGICRFNWGFCTFFAPVTLWKPQTPVHNLNYAEQQQRFKQMRKHPNGAGKETYRR